MCVCVCMHSYSAALVRFKRFMRATNELMQCGVGIAAARNSKQLRGHRPMHASAATVHSNANTAQKSKMENFKK